ncbi:uncharacterized protein PgNI_07194 [Pyricularia grisea]|uniref:Uncharacterized protein n=1 Tax=Pyricularia grisea TaxID=148305 RepID=A0A6P8B0R8_PYRGI|nr:uncharacterized protein PgNI_07194 [Pyricularia grisea]TLD08452.1 hypothetical protein PgNI_07194 [Pyricularia grisea]
MARFFYLICAIVATIAIAQAQLSKPALRNSLDAFWPQLQKRLRNPGYRIKQWPRGVISQGCKDLAGREGLDPEVITTYEVLYGDCSIPWLLCRHPDSKTSIETFALRFGQVPVRMRQFTKEALFVPDKSTHAYALGNQLVFFNQVESVGVYLHEVAHTVDFGSGYAVQGQLAANQIWLNAYANDSAVPDAYARSSQVENVAQFPGLALFDRLVPGGARTIESSVGRIARQMATLKDQARRGDYGGRLLGQRESCSARFPNSRPVVATHEMEILVFNEFIATRDDSVEAQTIRAAKCGVEIMAEAMEAIEPTSCWGEHGAFNSTE